ncbi:MAG: hypothetical protein ABL912_03575 [Novosphingobium sp.]
MSTSAELAHLIEQQAVSQGHALGWSHFYCPASRRENARLATIGLNPGGGRDASIDWRNLRQIEDPNGNSYLIQRWGHNGGFSTLQRQIARLLEVAGVAEQEVISLNAVPFRSPDWKSLENKKAAVSFGLGMLNDALVSSQLRVVVAFGLGSIEKRVAKQLGYGDIISVPTGWGKIMARQYRNAAGATMFGLPHLSRFAILGRPEAQELEESIVRAMREEAH